MIVVIHAHGELVLESEQFEKESKVFFLTEIGKLLFLHSLVAQEEQKTEAHESMLKALNIDAQEVALQSFVNNVTTQFKTFIVQDEKKVHEYSLSRHGLYTSQELDMASSAHKREIMKGENKFKTPSGLFNNKSSFVSQCCNSTPKYLSMVRDINNYRLFIEIKYNDWQNKQVLLVYIKPLGRLNDAGYKYDKFVFSSLLNIIKTLVIEERYGGEELKLALKEVNKDILFYACRYNDEIYKTEFFFVEYRFQIIENDCNLEQIKKKFSTDLDKIEGLAKYCYIAELFICKALKNSGEQSENISIKVVDTAKRLLTEIIDPAFKHYLLILIQLDALLNLCDGKNLAFLKEHMYDYYLATIPMQQDIFDDENDQENLVDPGRVDVFPNDGVDKYNLSGSYENRVGKSVEIQIEDDCNTSSSKDLTIAKDNKSSTSQLPSSSPLSNLTLEEFMPEYSDTKFLATSSLNVSAPVVSDNIFTKVASITYRTDCKSITIPNPMTPSSTKENEDSMSSYDSVDNINEMSGADSNLHSSDSMV